jgi:lipoprotein-anchoring transpeptidase ErfK/SrfK
MAPLRKRQKKQRMKTATDPYNLNRRAFIAGASALSGVFGLVACARTATRSTAIDPVFRRTVVPFQRHEQPGTTVVDPQNHHLYFVQNGAQAIRYGVGVGADGFVWSGVSTVHSKQEWPDWYPPKEMLQRKPEIRRAMSQLRSGLGMPGGPDNPLGARALYLWQGNRDTLYRIHGTNEPWSIGTNVSSGCIRLTNEDVSDLYDRVTVGSKVVVLSSRVANVQAFSSA